MRSKQYQHRTITLSAKKRTYALTRRRKQKRIYIRISSGGEISVSAPLSTSISAIETFLLSREGWIEKHIMRIQSIAPPIDPDKELLYRGQLFTIIKIGESLEERILFLDEERVVRIFFPGNADQESWRTTLKKELRRRSKKIISEAVTQLSRQLGISFSTIQIRDQKTRWGSSSGRGTISINWRIIMAPEEVMNYLLIHELVHQRKRNHGRDFWKEVEKYEPNYRDLDNWLKDYSFLMAFFRW